MSKYINADTVIQALRETIDKHKDSEMFTRTVRAAENMIRIIDRMPSADVVEVVRCKDCKYNYGIANNCEYAKDDIVCCYWESDGLHSDDFCSRGKRRDTE